MTGISHQHTQHLKPSLVLKSRTNNLKDQLRSQDRVQPFLSSFKPCFFTIRGGGGTAWKCGMYAPIQHLRRKERWFCSGTQSIIFQRWYLSFTFASGTYHIGSVNWVLTDIATPPTPIPIPRMRFNRASHRRQSEKRRNSRCIGAGPVSTWYRDPGLSWVRPGLMSFRGRLGVALCRANKESIWVFVCREVFRESVTRRNKMLSTCIILIWHS